MKKVIFGLVFFFIFILNVNASSGKLNNDSIISCNNITYGSHGNDNHFHVAIVKDHDYYASEDSLGTINPCNNYGSSSSNNSTIAPNKRINVTLSSCIDGDTAKFIINNEVKTTRFLAIDTPESTTTVEKYGKEASEFTCRALKMSKVITLEFDKNSDLYDKYNRLLAWVFVDNVLLQDEIVKAGLGEVAYLYDDYLYAPLLEDHEIIAKSKRLRVWSEYNSNKNDNNNVLFWLTNSIIGLIIIYFISKNKRKNS